MGHQVQFERWERARELLSEEQARALIDLLFRGDDAQFMVHGYLPDGVPAKSRQGLGGRHCKLPDGVHHIHLVPENIKRRVGKGGVIGGNKRIPDARLAAGLVLAHELQHANQTLIHKPGSQFYGKPFQPYLAQAAEREARQYADDNFALVAGTLNIELPREAYAVDTTEADLDDLVDCFAELDSVHLRDLVEELRGWGMNNSVNVRKAREKLNEMGVLVTSGSIPE